MDSVPTFMTVLSFYCTNHKLQAMRRPKYVFNEDQIRNKASLTLHRTYLTMLVAADNEGKLKKKQKPISKRSDTVINHAYNKKEIV